MDATLLILALSTGAASTAALGALPLFGRRETPARWLGWANALAAGMMLGAAYLLTTAQPDSGAIQVSIGAAAGVLFILATHRAAGVDNTRLNRLREEDATYGYQILLIDAFHGSSEGVAIGVAMVIEVDLGIFMAVAIALHNIPEATVLSAILTSRGVRLDQAAALSIASKLGQILLAVATFAVLTAAPTALPWALGFAAGALIQLVLLELLPESYHQAGQTSIAMVTVVALGVVVLAQGFVP